MGSRRREAFVLDALPLEIDGLRIPDNLALCDLSTAQELTGRNDITRIDLVVASILMSMGMLMVSPVVVSLPLKLAFFVVADGWSLLAGALVRGYG